MNGMTKKTYREVECCSNCKYCKAEYKSASYMGSMLCIQDKLDIPQNPYKMEEPTEEQYKTYENYIDTHKLEHDVCGICDFYIKE